MNKMNKEFTIIMSFFGITLVVMALAWYIYIYNPFASLVVSAIITYFMFRKGKK